MVIDLQRLTFAISPFSKAELIALPTYNRGVATFILVLLGDPKTIESVGEVETAPRASKDAGPPQPYSLKTAGFHAADFDVEKLRRISETDDYRVLPYTGNEPFYQRDKLPVSHSAELDPSERTESKLDSDFELSPPQAVMAPEEFPMQGKKRLHDEESTTPETTQNLSATLYKRKKVCPGDNRSPPTTKTSDGPITRTQLHPPQLPPPSPSPPPVSPAPPSPILGIPVPYNNIRFQVCGRGARSSAASTPSLVDAPEFSPFSTFGSLPPPTPENSDAALPHTGLPAYLREKRSPGAVEDDELHLGYDRQANPHAFTPRYGRQGSTVVPGSKYKLSPGIPVPPSHPEDHHPGYGPLRPAWPQPPAQPPSTSFTFDCQVSTSRQRGNSASQGAMSEAPLLPEARRPVYALGYEQAPRAGPSNYVSRSSLVGPGMPGDGWRPAPRIAHTVNATAYLRTIPSVTKLPSFRDSFPDLPRYSYY